MAKPIRPIIVISATPNTADRGNTIALSARFFDKRTRQEQEVSRIFMTITSMRDGHIVWPLEVVRKDASGFDIVIGTKDMKQDHEYLVRVSNNWNLSPSASTTFFVEKKTSTFPVLPLIPLIPLFLPEITETVNLDILLNQLNQIDIKELTLEQRQELKEYIKRIKILQQEDIIVTPVDLKRAVKEYIFRTQMDFRVCPICKPFENRVFEPEDPAIPIIPLHINCRCTMDVVYVDAEGITEDLRNIANVASIAASSRVPLMAISVINSHFYN